MTLFQAFGAFAGQAAEPTSGMVLVTPTSASQTGGSGSLVGATYSFTDAEDLTLNGIFSSTYDDYLIVMNAFCSNAGGVTTTRAQCRMTSSGTPATSGDYDQQEIEYVSTTEAAAQVVGATVGRFGSVGPVYNGFQVWVSNPYVADGTAIFGSHAIASSSTAPFRNDYYTLHDVATSYDGFQILWNAPDIATGQVHVYGLTKAVA